MNILEYLKFAIAEKCYRKKAWIISVFSVTVESDDQKKKTYPGKFIREPFGFFFIDSSGERVKIETKNSLTEPLLSPKDRLIITPELIGSVKQDSLETTVGNLLVNLICIYEAFGDKFPYKTGSFTPKSIEADIVKKLKSNPKAGESREEGVYYIDEYLKFCEGVLFLEGFTQVFTHSITRHGLLPAPGRKEFRDTLVKKYGDTLKDPVEMARFEEELSAFDKAYLKSDPSFGKFMSGKVAKSRMKAYMTQGGESNSFVQSMDVVPIIQPLEEGIPLDKEGFTAIANTIRYGSYSRGSETVNGGVTAKALMRAADNWEITDGDCGTTLGIRRLYREDEIEHIVGRYVVQNGKSNLVSDKGQAMQFAGQKIVLRSPQYCRRASTQTCQVCAGLALSKYPTGLPIPLMEVSGGILTDSLKLMHNTALMTETVHLPSVIT